MKILQKNSIIFILYFLFFNVGYVYAQQISSDINDLYSLPKPNPITDKMDLETIVDLKGYIPIAGVSKKKKKYQDESITNFFTDTFQYYKFPTKESIAYLYYAADAESDKAIYNVEYFTEDKLEGEYLKWAKFAYSLTKNSGTQLYNSLTGSSSCDSVEPIVLLFTKTNVIIFINFKYSGIDRKGTGQILCAYEFSRKLIEYKTFYEICSTEIIGKNLKDAFNDSLPIIEASLKALNSQ